jgi:hypothetical protein
MIRQAKVAVISMILARGLLRSEEAGAWEGDRGGYPESGGADSWVGYTGVGTAPILARLAIRRIQGGPIVGDFRLGRLSAGPIVGRILLR